MSGGYFNHKELAIYDIIDAIELIIFDNDEPEGRGYEPITIREFEKAVIALRLAKIYADRIDYLLGGDDSPLRFHERLEEELKDVLGELNETIME